MTAEPRSYVMHFTSMLTLGRGDQRMFTGLPPLYPDICHGSPGLTNRTAYPRKRWREGIQPGSFGIDQVAVQPPNQIYTTAYDI